MNDGENYCEEIAEIHPYSRGKETKHERKDPLCWTYVLLNTLETHFSMIETRSKAL